MHNVLITSDLHLTDNSRDEYRWSIFDVLRAEASKLGAPPPSIYILGDVTDKKDNHSSVLVNRLVTAFLELRPHVSGITILKGNHDYTTGYPFFGFLGNFDGITYMAAGLHERRGELWLPHTRTPGDDWQSLDFARYGAIFMHETAKGSIVSTGATMDGIDPEIPARASALIVSGDIHVPQQVGRITYVGSPYHVHFGDRFDPRILYVDEGGAVHSIPTGEKFPHRFTAEIKTVDDLDPLELQDGDMIKVRIADVPGEKFRELRAGVLEYCGERGVEVSGMEIVRADRGGVTATPHSDGSPRGIPVDSEAVVRSFGARENLAEDVVEDGVSIAREV